MNAFSHEVLFYSGLADFARRCAPFLREGIAAGEPALVMVGAKKIEALKRELGPDSEHVTFENMEVAGLNPARIIPAWREFAESHPGKLLRGIGEPIWAERSPAELIECQRHEALINVAFLDAAGFRLMCPYDLEALPDEVIEEARRSHPLVLDGASLSACDHYVGLDEIVQPFDVPLPEPPADAARLEFGAGELARVRDFVAAHCEALAGRGDDLITAVNEAASNSVRHAGGRGSITIWADDGAVLCEVRDEGGVVQPLAGRVKPEPLRPGGQGLWLMNQLCDLVQLRAYGDSGAVRLHVRAPAEYSQAA